jgi:proliferating cell nuclear antigen
MFEVDDCVLEIKTVQISPFRTLMTALKDILLETNIVFRKEGMSITNMDKSHTILVNLFLKADNFEKYVCKHPKIVIGVNMTQLFKIINTIDNDATLTIYIRAVDYNDGVVNNIGLLFENGDIKQANNHILKLIEPDDEDIEMPDVKYSLVINMPSADFQKIVRDMSSISDRIEIKSVGNELSFVCKGPFATSEIKRTESDGKMDIVEKDDPSKIFQGEFALKNLSYFIKCTNLCNSIEILLENDLPLIVTYKVASLGELNMCLTPLPRPLQKTVSDK